MKVVKGIENIFVLRKRPVITMGNFDGIHMGHIKILKTLKQRSHDYKALSIVITFEPHPRNVLDHNIEFLPLTNIENKLNLIRGYGIDVVIIVSFTRKLSRLKAKEFIEKVIFKRLKFVEIIFGKNHFFGAEKEGDKYLLKELGKQFDFSLKEVMPAKSGKTVISSSLVRKMLLGGYIEKANKMLNRFYSISGKVIKGRGIGGKIGYKTANIDAKNLVLPGNGVYEVNVKYNNRNWKGLANIGKKPTLLKTSKNSNLEVHILEFRKDIYGETIRVEFIRKLREEKKFDNLNLLKKQIVRDIKNFK